jgi:dihydroorotase
MITHLYHGNLGQVIDDKGKVLPVVRDAESRGVVFDSGWRIQFLLGRRREVLRPGFDPHHQLGPTAVQRRATGQVAGQRHERNAAPRLDAAPGHRAVTRNAAKAISLTDRAGSLRPGQPADITVFRVETGNYEISDCYTKVRRAEKQIVRLPPSRRPSGSMPT